MSSTLLLRLAGPMQAWGTHSRFTERETGQEPSKSGVIGTICAAMGRGRDEPVDDLGALKMGVRVDREGTMKVDYHTAGGGSFRGMSYGVRKADGTSGETVVSRRYYLSDADFLVGLEGEEGTLRAVERALAEPRWQIFLGRKSFAPGVPVWIPNGVLIGTSLETALVKYPWPRPGTDIPPPERRPEKLRLVIEVEGETRAVTGEVRRDQPVGAAFQNRHFVLRHVATSLAALGGQVPLREE